MRKHSRPTRSPHRVSLLGEPGCRPRFCGFSSSVSPTRQRSGHRRGRNDGMLEIAMACADGRNDGMLAITMACADGRNDGMWEVRAEPALCRTVVPAIGEGKAEPALPRPSELHGQREEEEERLR